MNDAMESRVEVLAFQYVGLGLFMVVNNIWTLVAVVTAAVSVWSIRAAGSSTVRRRRQPNLATPYGDGGSIGRSDGRGPTPELRPADAAEESAPASADVSSAASTSADYTSSDLGDGVTKGSRKFTAYYKDDGGFETAAAEADEVEEEEAGKGGSYGVGEWWESWERVLKARNGEMSWYRCQDTRVINGAVVRLWDESRCGSERMDGSHCVVW